MDVIARFDVAEHLIGVDLGSREIRTVNGHDIAMHRHPVKSKRGAIDIEPYVRTAFGSLPPADAAIDRSQKVNDVCGSGLNRAFGEGGIRKRRQQKRKERKRDAGSAHGCPI